MVKGQTDANLRDFTENTNPPVVVFRNVTKVVVAFFLDEQRNVQDTD